MESKNQSDSIFMTLLRSAMDETHKKIRSITGPIECLTETSKFYELAIIQIDAFLKLVIEQPEDQTHGKKMLTDLIRLNNLLHERLNGTKRLIIRKDRALTERLETGIRLKQHAMIKQMNSDIDMLKERLDHTYEQIHRSNEANEVRHVDQQCRWLIEKETILIAIKGYIDTQSIECSKKDIIIARLLNERQQSAFQTMAMDEHYMVLLNDSYKDFQDYEIETKVREDVFIYVFMEVLSDMRIKFDFELRRIQSEIGIVLKQLLKEFQENVNEKLTNLSRLDGIKKRVDSLSRQAAYIRNEGVLYKRAFARRCENLLLAETEVDLLGDQVEALQGLLQKIYIVLDQNSSDLSQNFQVTDIMTMINNDFTGLIISK